MEAQHLRELGSYNDDLSNAKLDLITIRNKTNEEMDILKEEHTLQKKNMQAKHDAEMQKKIAELQFTMQNQSGKAQDDLMNKHAEDKHALELAHIKEVSELANRHNTERGHLTKNYTEASQEVQTLKSERAALKKTHEEEKAQLNLQIMKVHEERASILQERSQAHQKEIEDLQHSTSESHQKQLDDLDDKLRMEMETLSEGYEKQKQEDIKRLQDEYEVKISGFKKTMEESMNFITKKNTDQEELQKRNIELIGELDKSKTTKQQLSENLTKLQTNYQSLQAQKEKEITELNNTKAEVIKNYDAHIAKTEGELKAQLQKDRADALSIIETQTRNCQIISNKLAQREKDAQNAKAQAKEYKFKLFEMEQRVKELERMKASQPPIPVDVSLEPDTPSLKGAEQAKAKLDTKLLAKNASIIARALNTVKREAEQTAIDLMATLPTETVTESVMLFSTASIPTSSMPVRAGYVYHWNPWEDNGKGGWLEITEEQERKNQEHDARIKQMTQHMLRTSRLANRDPNRVTGVDAIDIDTDTPTPQVLTQYLFLLLHQ